MAWRKRVGDRRLLAGLVGAFILLYVLLFSYLTTGNLLPHTLAAKTLDSGLLWGIRNGNLQEVLISLSLNPLVWGGSMLILLVCLNLVWSLFWISFMRSWILPNCLKKSKGFPTAAAMTTPSFR